MEEPSTTSYAGRTLVVLLCMHRSGSSLVGNLFQRLGMSLGPFELLGASLYNRYGHFEALPIYRLDQELLAGRFDFHEDVPTDADVLRRFCEAEGRWTLEESPIDEAFFERGAELIRQLVESGPISGFKDPRVPLLWPFWERVLAGFAGLRVVPIFLARSPHEIAMSIFVRSSGALDYRDALDVTAVHYKRLVAIRNRWPGEQAVVRFEPGLLADDARSAAKLCGLAWNDEVFAQAYDAACRHHEAARVEHEVQSLYEDLCSGQSHPSANFDRLLSDSAVRERILRDGSESKAAEIVEYRSQLADCREQIERYQCDLATCRRQLDDSCQAIERLKSQLALITGSRTWRWRQRLVSMPPLRWLKDSHPPETSDTPAAAACAAPAVATDPASLDRPCTIVIPVYNAFAEAQECLCSVLEHTPSDCRVLVVDDCSPAGEFADVLPQELRNDCRLHIVRNARNLGFVRSCNWAIKHAAPDDLVLLNSDTEVTPRWLDKMKEAAASRADVGTVTPLTNSGTICSVPEFLADNRLPAGHDLESFAALIEAVSAREYPELPTCVGFCVYIKREVIERIGAFDAETFGRGYGEENDFSCRLQAAGYVDILDDATFVYHHGSMSFGTETEHLRAEHVKTVARLHPHFDRRVQRFALSNPLRHIHGRIGDALVQRWSDKADYTVLHVLHNRPITHGRASLPGGIEYHVADLIRMIPEAAHWSFYAAAGEYCLTAHAPGKERHYRVPRRALDLSALFSRDLFDVVHVHHTNSLDYQALAGCLLEHGRYFVSVHDFRLCCPTINLLKPNGQLCNGHECVAACRRKPAEIRSLRATTDQVLQHAQAVFHFSESTKHEFVKILGGPYPWQRIEHGVDLPPRSAGSDDPDCLAQPSPDVPFRVAFLGGIGINKGADLVRQLVRHTRLPGGVPIEWHLVGLIDGSLDPVVQQHGRYDRSELPAIMKSVSPHVVAILSIWPETYCYTFDEALACGIPIVATPLGGPAERLRRHDCGWLVDSLTVPAVMRTLQHVVDHWDEYRDIRRRIPTITLNCADAVARQYHALYRGVCQTFALSGLERLAVIERHLKKAVGRRRVSLQRRPVTRSRMHGRPGGGRDARSGRAGGPPDPLCAHTTQDGPTAASEFHRRRVALRTARIGPVEKGSRMADTAIFAALPKINNPDLEYRKYLNFLVALRQRRRRTSVVSSRPFDITTDMSTACHLHCPYCGTGNKTINPRRCT